MRILAGALLAAAMAVGPAAGGHAGDAIGQVRKLKDLAGREVSVPATVHRLVALGPGALRLVAYLQAVDRVVGIEDMEKRMDRPGWFRPYASALPKDFFERPVVGPGGPGKLPDFERLILSRPDVIIAVSIDPSELRTIETKTGIPTVGLSYGELGAWGREVRESLRILGALLGKEKRAQHVNAYILALEEDLRQRTKAIPAQAKPSVYFGGISFKGAQGITSTQDGYTPASMVDARNVAAGRGKRSHVLIDKEQILAWNPDVIFIDIASRSIVDEDFARDRGFYRRLKAADAGRVFSLLPYNSYNTNIEIALLNAYFIGKCLYPGSFEDVEMRLKAGEIFGELLGIRMDGAVPAYEVVRFPETGPIQWGPARSRQR